MSKFTEQLNKYASDLTLGEWNVTEDGVYLESEKSGRTYASHIAVVPTALYENMDTHAEKVELTYYKKNRWKSVIVDRAIIASPNSIVKLATDGIEVTSINARTLIQYLSEVITRSLDTIQYKPSRSVLGWVEDDFVPYTGDITFDGEDTFKYLFRAVAKRGTLSEWVDYIRPLRQNKAMRLAMAASFASPLIELIGENPFVLHLWGGTGTAKTVSLMVAMSIWGDPTGGKLTRTMNMTANSMLSTAAFLNNLPFAGDELQTIKNRWDNYDNLIMCITEGIDRGRMTFDKVNEIRTWKCAFIFTGEEPCIKAASGGGAKNRVIEVHVKNRILKNGNAVVNFVRHNYGAAALPYLSEVKRTDTQQIYNDIFAEIISDYDTTDKQAGSMALMLTADRIASNLFWKDEKSLTVSDVREYMFTASEVDIAERAYAFIKDCIAENVNNFSRESRSVWGIIEDGAAYMNKSVLCRVLNSEGFDFAAVKSAWCERGYIEKNNQGNLRHRKSFSGAYTDCIKIPLTDDSDVSELLGEPVREDETLPFNEPQPTETEQTEAPRPKQTPKRKPEPLPWEVE